VRHDSHFACGSVACRSSTVAANDMKPRCCDGEALEAGLRQFRLKVFNVCAAAARDPRSARATSGTYRVSAKIDALVSMAMARRPVPILLY
jgi:hypothetical protein